MPIRRPTLILLIVASCLGGCAGPKPESRLVSPDGRHAAEVFKIGAGAGHPLPFYRVWLRRDDGKEGSLLVAEGMESLCGMKLGWQGNALVFALPVPEAPCLRAAPGLWDGVELKAGLHEDQVRLQSKAPKGSLRLVQISNCEGTQWNLFVRRGGEPNYNADMDKGWADASLLGGFDQRRILKSVAWKDGSHAVLTLQGWRGQVQTRDEALGLHVTWVFSGGDD